jgi:hypothetical protein
LSGTGTLTGSNSGQLPNVVIDSTAHIQHRPHHPQRDHRPPGQLDQQRRHRQRRR